MGRVAFYSRDESARLSLGDMLCPGGMSGSLHHDIKTELLILRVLGILLRPYAYVSVFVGQTDNVFLPYDR